MIIREKSIAAFFGTTENEMYKRNEYPARLLRGEVVIENKMNFSIGNEVVFELKDRIVDADKPVVCFYKYVVEEYDSISVKLSLVDFKIELIK